MEYIVRHKKKYISVFQVSRPYLGFCPDPKHFIVNCEQNVVKFAGKWEKIYGPGHEKTCLMSYANNKGADQTARMRSLISIFVVHYLDSIIPLVSISKISRL